jgi:ATP-dependent DNA ligase
LRVWIGDEFKGIFVVVDWTDPAGSRSHSGALLLGYYTEDGRLHYAGRAATGHVGEGVKALGRRC